MEQDNLPQVDHDGLAEMQRQLLDADAERKSQQQQLTQLQVQLPEADARRNSQRVAIQDLERQLSQTEATLSALQQLQQQVDNNQNLKEWLTRYQLDQTPRLWQSIDIEAGWEDALEAVLRERLNALGLSNLDVAAQWVDAPPAKLAVFVADEAHSPKVLHDVELMPLVQFVSCRDTRTTMVVSDWLANVYAAKTLEQGLSLRHRLPAGAWLVTPQGHLIGVHSLLFHAPDDQVHGVLARQREIERLQEAAQQQRKLLDQGNLQMEETESAYRSIESRIAPVRAVDGELQERQHEIQVNILKFTQAKEYSQERATQIARELQELTEQSTAERSQLEGLAERMNALREGIATQQADAEMVKGRATTE
ncbi:MAG: chromosome segregation protein SMC, partial [Proteobacteria bacterium]|nr:chromosome segregation protein SMC [Pseudomonadota bacterium]